ncbi:380_t:CDS:2 [Funneliformis mosseae]|uniref:380_t:CDS:1 n=1 Tax=Funneliformis mosseae TaxID=27381 RepID=A0A9N9C6A4_FUNMO|nr:380_t:CDS:2 [Funneliformis mosseae]
MKSLYTNLFPLLAAASLVAGQTAKLGQWDFVGHSGVSTMHGILSPGTNKVLFIERVELATEVTINGKPTYTVEYDLDTNTIRPLTTISNTFCSAGGYLMNGTVMNLGGAESAQEVNQGFNKIRTFEPCNDGKCDWMANNIDLSVLRWYPSVEQLADGTLFILGGANKGVAVNDPYTNVPSYELFPPRGKGGSYPIDFLTETLPYNLYPSVHLLPDSNLFIMANTKSIIFDTKTFTKKTDLPEIPGPPRHYPLTGGSIILPLDPANNYEPEILVCGGADQLTANAKGENTCGRIRPLSKNPTWDMEEMPFGRLMPDIALLSNGDVMILNGCLKGTAGFGKGTDPVLTPIMYNPSAKKGARMTQLQPSYIPRMYHSIAFTVPSGQLLVSGSNPNKNPTGEGPYPTDFRVELFTAPFHFTGQPQPWIKQAPAEIKYGQTFEIELVTYSEEPKVFVNILNSGFVTHSTHMSQRQIWLESELKADKLSLKAPPNGGVAPPGPYLMFVVDNGVPSKAVWIMLGGK